MKPKKKVLIVLSIVIIIAIITIMIMLYKSGNKKIQILMDMSKKIYRVNEYKDDNIYFKTENNYGYTEVYKYFETTKSITYDKNTHLKYTIIKNSDMTEIDYLESDDDITKIMCKRSVEKDNTFELGDELFTNNEVHLFQVIKYGLKIEMSNENINGKNCYILNYVDNNIIYYIDQETLLPIKIVNQIIDERGNESLETTYYDIQYNNVIENDVQKLDEENFIIVDENQFDEYYDEQLKR